MAARSEVVKKPEADQPTPLGPTGTAVIVELATDWARRELIGAWDDWCAERTRTACSHVEQTPSIVARGGMVNDLFCLHWLGLLNGGSRAGVEPARRVDPRARECIPPWTFVAVLRGPNPALACSVRALEHRVRGLGRVEVLPIADHLISAACAGRVVPAAVHCVNRSLVASRWLQGSLSEGLLDSITHEASELASRLPAGLMRDSHPIEQQQIPPPTRLLWRAYDRSTRDTPSHAGASAALVDGFASAFAAAEVDLILIKPFGESEQTAEIVGVPVPVESNREDRVAAAFRGADQVAAILGYTNVTPDRTRRLESVAPEPRLALAIEVALVHLEVRP